MLKAMHSGSAAPAAARAAAARLSAAPCAAGAPPCAASTRRRHAAGAALHATAGMGVRVGHVKRVTKETSVEVMIDLDGTGVCVAESGIPFLDHMLDVRCACGHARRLRRVARGGAARAGVSSWRMRGASEGRAVAGLALPCAAPRCACSVARSAVRTRHPRAQRRPCAATPIAAPPPVARILLP
jgi:hypothetical protein